MNDEKTLSQQEKSSLQEEKALSSQEMVMYLMEAFPGGDSSTLGEAGLKEAVRVAKALNEIGMLLQTDFALIVSYALAFQRWMEHSRRVNELKNPYVTGANGFMQTHPAIGNEQKYFSIFRASLRHLLGEINERFLRKDDPDADKLSELEEYLQKKTECQRGKDS